MLGGANGLAGAVGVAPADGGAVRAAHAGAESAPDLVARADRKPCAHDELATNRGTDDRTTEPHAVDRADTAPDASADAEAVARADAGPDTRADARPNDGQGRIVGDA